MKKEELIFKEIENSTYSIIFCHGILGTPHHFDFLVSLIPEGISYYLIKLDGHGKGVRDFSKASMKKWENQVSELIKYLKERNQKIIYVGHSMGTLFGIDEALKSNDIEQLFLLNPPLTWHYTFKTFCMNIAALFSTKKDDHQKKIEEDCSVTLSKNIFLYIGWIPRYLELFAKMRNIKRRIKDLKTPCIAYHSIKDELVSKNTLNYISKNKNIDFKILIKSGHYYYLENEKVEIESTFSSILKSL